MLQRAQQSSLVPQPDDSVFIIDILPFRRATHLDMIWQFYKTFDMNTWIETWIYATQMNICIFNCPPHKLKLVSNQRIQCSQTKIKCKTKLFNCYCEYHLTCIYLFENCNINLYLIIFLFLLKIVEAQNIFARLRLHSCGFSQKAERWEWPRTLNILSIF